MTGRSCRVILSHMIEALKSKIPPRANLTYELFLLMRDFSHLRFAAFVSIKIET